MVESYNQTTAYGVQFDLKNILETLQLQHQRRRSRTIKLFTADELDLSVMPLRDWREKKWTETHHYVE